MQLSFWLAVLAEFYVLCAKHVDNFCETIIDFLACSQSFIIVKENLPILHFNCYPVLR